MHFNRFNNPMYSGLIVVNFTQINRNNGYLVSWQWLNEPLAEMVPRVRVYPFHVRVFHGRQAGR